jgi:hypothetical protein
MKNFVSLITTAALLSGCDTMAPVAKLDTVRTFQEPFDQVWPALVQTTSKDDYPLKIVQKDSGVIETENFTPGSFASCATSPSGLFLPCWSDSRARLSILATPNGSNTVVKVIGHFERYEYNVYNSWFVWDSTGQFENLFLNDVSAAMAH